MKIIFSLIIILMTTFSWAGIPPKYLSVPGWQSCVDEVKPAGSTSSSVCLPSSRPGGCSPDSWKKLTKGGMLPSCGYQPSSKTPTFELKIK